MTTTTKRPMSTHAKAAKMIRTELKRHYPATKFKVRAHSYAGGDAVSITWEDGPTVKQVEALVEDYQQCSFDGMQDLKEYTNVRDYLPQVDWVQCERSMTPAARDACVAHVNQRRGWNLQIEEMKYGGYRYLNDEYIGNGWQSEYVWRTFYVTSLECGECHTTDLLPGDRFCPQCGAGLPSEEV